MSKREERPSTALELVERPREVQARFELVIAKPDLLERICEHVANGGSLVTLCRMWVVSYRRMMNWIKRQENGAAAYNEAMAQRQEWVEEMVMADLHNYAQADIRDLFNEAGDLINPHDLEDHVAPSIQSLQVKRRVDDTGTVETTFDYKLVDKLKTRDMLLRTLGKYIDKTEHSGTVNLADIIAGSHKKNEKI